MSATQLATTSTGPAAAPESSGRVLVIDDDERVLQGWKRLLRAAGFQVELLSDSRGLVDLVARERFDAILSDIRMPGLDGLGVLRVVRERCGEVPVVLATGDADLASAMKAVEGGAFRYLQKPLDPEVLEGALHEAVRARRAALAREAATQPAGARRERPILERRFEGGLAKRWLAYQPIVDRRTWRIAAYEILLRTSEPGLARPHDFLAAARELGRLHELGRAIRSDVAGALHQLPGDVRAFVNIDPVDLEDPELYLASAPLSRVATRIVLEVTERASLAQVADLADRIRALRELGFSLAVDDLGAGFAGLSSFALLHPEIVKVDMSLVRAVDGDPVRRKIVESITSASHDLGTSVVAEGVETEAERDALADLGVDLLQGYLFGRPQRSAATAIEAGSAGPARPAA
jgi:EAL domain-containing protein (putative c-di-GMP-specific phosphodiesterase class I)